MTPEQALNSATLSLLSAQANNSTEFARLEALLQTRKEENRQLMDLITETNAHLQRITARLVNLEGWKTRVFEGNSPLIKQP